MTQKIDNLTHKFITLASKSLFTEAERQEVKSLMKQLKETGMSPAEISELSSGRGRFRAGEPVPLASGRIMPLAGATLPKLLEDPRRVGRHP